MSSIPAQASLKRSTNASLDAATSAFSPSAGASAWVIRAGRGGEYEQLALKAGLCVIGWSTMGQLSADASRDDLEELLAATYHGQGSSLVAAQARRIYRFVHEVATGDVVVLPLMRTPGHIAVGRIRGTTGTARMGNSLTAKPNTRVASNGYRQNSAMRASIRTCGRLLANRGPWAR
jgi:hypothetical protein